VLVGFAVVTQAFLLVLDECPVVVADALASDYLQVGTGRYMEERQGHTYGRLVVR
jgi:hypothetical protein